MDESTSQDKEYLVSLNVMTKDQSQLSRITEVLARAGVGLTLEGGLTVNMNMTELEASSEEVGEQP